MKLLIHYVAVLVIEMPPTRGHDLKPLPGRCVLAADGCPPHGGTT